MSDESTCTLVLTRQMVEDLSLAAVVDYPLSPTPLSEEERLHFTNLREAWRRSAPVYTDLAATDVEWLCTLIDRLSSPSVDPEDFAECDHCGGPLNAARPEENPDD